MKKIISILIAVILTGNMFAQTVTQTLEDFSSLKINSAIDIILIQGANNQINIEGILPEDLNKIEAKIAGDVLLITTATDIRLTENSKIIITFKNLNNIMQDGDSGNTLTNKIIVKGSGAIDVDFNINVNEFTIDFSGASDIKLTGKVNQFNVKLTGASDLKAGGLIAKNLTVNISGASDATLFVDSAISGTISGASDIHIKGNPSYRNINNSSTSSVSSAGDDFNMKIGKNNNLVVNDENVNLNLGKNKIQVIDDTTNIKFFGYKLLVINDSVSLQKEKEKIRRNHWAGLDLGINGFLNANNGFDLSNDPLLALTHPKEVTQFMELNYSKSWSVSLNFMEFFIKIKDYHFGLVTGLGTEWNNYELKHNVRLTPEGGSYIYPTVDEYTKDYTWGIIDTNFNYSKNRFKTWFINAPLLLELNTGNHKNKSFHLSAGAIFGFDLQTKMKYIYEENGTERKEKDKQSFNTNPFRVNLTARAGLGWFNVFATYSLTPLFENNRGPKLYPFTIGITLLGF